jgi:hypothetical protein
MYIDVLNLKAKTVLTDELLGENAGLFQKIEE